MPHIGLEYKEKGIDFITDNTVSDKDARAAFELRIQNKSLRYDEIGEKTGLLAKRWDGYFEGSKIRISSWSIRRKTSTCGLGSGCIATPPRSVKNK
jgi:hypothetical protein